MSDQDENISEKDEEIGRVGDGNENTMLRKHAVLGRKCTTGHLATKLH